MAQDQTSRGVTVSAREWRIFKWAPQKSTFHPNCCVAEKISCLHIIHMRRCEIFSAPCIWANSELLEAFLTIWRGIRCAPCSNHMVSIPLSPCRPAGCEYSACAFSRKYDPVPHDHSPA